MLGLIGDDDWQPGRIDEESRQDAGADARSSDAVAGYQELIKWTKG